MGTSDGLRRGLKVNNLDHPIEVPVGKATLGRILNVLGQPIDMKGDIGERKSVGRFTARRQATKSCPAPRNCWKPVSR